MKPRAGPRVPRTALVIALAATSAACPEPVPDCAAPGARDVIELLGERMARVSLLGPDREVAREIRDAYSGIVTDELLASWIEAPRTAPGRLVSSPWPARIEIDAVSRADSASCRVDGAIVLVSSVDAGQRGEAARQPVTLWVTHRDEWLVTRYERGRMP